MQHKLLTLLFCVAFVATVQGYSQIRLVNACFCNQTIDVTTSIYARNNISMAVKGGFPESFGGIPSSNFILLPTSLFPLYQYNTAYAYDADNLAIPIEYLSNYTGFTLQDQQLYTFIYVAGSDPNSNAPATDVPAQLFLYEEIAPYPGSMIKFVNLAVSTYGNTDLSVKSSSFNFSIPFGGETSFVAIPFGNYYVDIAGSGINETLFVNVYNLSNVIYIYGNIGGYFRVDHTETRYEDMITPVAQPPVAAPYYSSTPSTPSPVSPQLRFINGIDQYLDYILTATYNGNYPTYNLTTSYVSSYKTLYSGQGTYWLAIYDMFGSFYSSTWAYLSAGLSYSIYGDMYGSIYVLADTPTNFTRTLSYIRVVNVAQVELEVWVGENTHGETYSVLGYTSIWDFQEYNGGGTFVRASSQNQTIEQSFFVSNGTAVTVYILGGSSDFYFNIDVQVLPQPTQPVCVNGYVESNGVCNCFSGYTTYGSSPYKCSVGSPSYCFQNQSDSLSNDVVPYMPWWNQVYGNQLQFTILSQMVPNRRTIVELPNSQCSFINSPQYYQQSTYGCQDRVDVTIPYTDCGFIKTSTSTEDVYRGTVHVKQIDRVTVAGTTYDRVIDTPMPIAIRMPKTLAVQSYLQVFGPPSLAIDAAFVGQTVSTESQSGDLQYVSAVQYPLQIDTVQLVDLPYGVDAWIEVINVNCTGVGPCVQRLEIHVNTSSCSISGTYRMVVSLSCRSDNGCPEEAKNGTQVYIESRIVSQSLCGEVSVDIDLNGYIQAYTDQSFSNSALAFYPGQSAYFLISAFSSRVSLSRVSVESVYYYGPNVNYQYLSYNATLSDIAVANNFSTGSFGSNQAWFGLDISVNTPSSGDDNALFKLYQGQNGVYNFVAIVDVEWFVSNPITPTSAVTPVAPVVPVAPSVPVGPTPTPFYPPTDVPFAFKKRMTLAGSVSNQGSQFTAQVQVAGPTPSSVQPPQQQQQQPTPVATSKPESDPVSSSASLSCSLVVIAVTGFFALF